MRRLQFCLAMYLVVAEKQGADWKKISGTLQNDILKEYIAQKEWIYPIQPAMKLVVDTFEFCTQHVPRYNPISVSGYHIREAGATAIQELAFTLRDGLEYVEWGLKAGLISTFSCHESPSSSTPTTTFSRKSQSTGPHGGSGRREMRDRFGSTNERITEASFPHADRGSFADRAATAQQHRSGCDSGAGRCFRRHTEFAY